MVKPKDQVGQVDIFGTVQGLEKIVRPPHVINSEGLKVIHFAISEDDRAVPGYLQTAMSKARALQPEVRSRGKPPWANAHWQAKRRKIRAGVL